MSGTTAQQTILTHGVYMWQGDPLSPLWYPRALKNNMKRCTVSRLSIKLYPLLTFTSEPQQLVKKA